MPTEKPRIMVTVDEDMLSRIEQYRYLNKHPSLSKAATELLLKGLMSENAEAEPSRFFSGDMVKLINIFNHTDEDGRAAIMSAAIKGKARHVRRSRTLMAIDEDTNGALMIEEIQNLLTLYQMADEKTRLAALDMLSSTEAVLPAAAPAINVTPAELADNADQHHRNTNQGTR